MTHDWLFLPPWGLPVLAAVFVVLGVLVALRAVREGRVSTVRRQITSLVLRGVVVLALLWIALNPTLVRHDQQGGKPKLVVLVDTSQSMTVADMDGQPRLAAALQTLNDADVRAMLTDTFDLDVRRFDRDAAPATLESLSADAADGRFSDPAAALTSAVSDLSDAEAQAGVLLISDGRATAGGFDDAARLALARSTPVWAWAVGGEVERRDVWIEAPSNDVLAFAGDEVELAATLQQSGYDDRAFRVEVLDENGAVLHTLDAAPGPDGSVPLKATVSAPDDGERRFTFRVSHDAGEADAQNNERAVYARAVGQKVRVLIVEGQPHWDSKFLVQALKRSPRVEVTAIYRLGEDKQFAIVSADGEQRRETGDLFPRSSEAFQKYDVVMLGRGCEAFFDDQTDDHLSAFVAEHGGSLVFARGKSYGGRFAPLAKYEPVVWGTLATSDVRIDPTTSRTGMATSASDSPILELAPAGDLDALIDRLPRLDMVRHTVGVKPLAVILAGGQGDLQGQAAPGPNGVNRMVVLAYQQFGQGRVVTLNASGLWRWAFRDDQEQTDDAVYERFWISTLRWLLSGSDFLAGHDVALRSNRRLYTDEQIVSMLVRTRGLEAQAYRPTLRISPQDGDGETVQIEPRAGGAGHYHAQVGPLRPGAYQVTLVNNIGRPTELTTTVRVAPSTIENRVLSADRATMQRIAETSGGQVVDADDVANLDTIVRRWQARQQLAERKRSLWDRWWILALIVACLGGEWYLRRREGLL